MARPEPKRHTEVERARAVRGQSRRRSLDPMVAERVEQALARLRDDGRLAGERGRRLSVRVDPGLVAAAAERIGTENPTDIIESALALLASPDPFVHWLLTTGDRLPEDFELAI
ncbi:hypothetical protein [Salinarimonas chemoclinalis]|uniref:hypothetical protein n=1 Tax=Salinarimonas chemoclinalis TaxID=3241599 RepID=UPI003558804E